MNQKEQLMHSGFQILETENQDNKLLDFLKENYPSIIRDNEINVNELKALSGLPVDDKVNGYGLNFIGRNVARAKYANKTTKEVKVNHNQSKNFDTTQNLVLKGDNMESLKILKSHYSGAIKCIYIDPPYNTKNDEFVYPDKFDKEEAEVLGLANVSETDMERMEFSFKTKQSHNGWLSFMYPRLLLARDLLAKDGVIFISIDDNEQANLKLLCDEIFGEENFLNVFIWRNGRTSSAIYTQEHEYILLYGKNKELIDLIKYEGDNDLISDRAIKKIGYKNPASQIEFPSGMRFDSEDRVFPNLIGSSEVIKVVKGKFICKDGKLAENVTIEAGWVMKDMIEDWINGKEVLDSKGQKVTEFFFKDNGVLQYVKERGTVHPKTIIEGFSTKSGTNEIINLLGFNAFDYPKPVNLICFLQLIASKNDIILDFFAGSGTTGHAVMQLNAEDGGNRKFILCQIDEPIKKDKPAYQFCVDNNLPPVISSITIERLNRAGEKIKTEIETENNRVGMFDENKKQIPDIGYKVFDTTNAPELEMEVNGQIVYPSLTEDALSRIYNLIFSVGIDSPVSVLECVVENSIYKIGNNYYITNSADVNNDDIANAIKNGKVFVDGWSAGINTTLQHYKEDVKIVF
ncbi:site-specific DNA-methyltransferase [Chryseobacterium sp.]|uniref:site-specific DNA-methyltransferase n=1 Tax=Chryseobacterium sp. TaxID=1871047 RepID=UPI002FC5D0DE